MKMAQLSTASGIAVPTIKMYLREGLLPPGERIEANQSRYTEGHVRRLRLIQALMRIGGLSVAAAREVLGAIDSDLELGHVFAAASQAATRALAAQQLDAHDFERADEMIGGWRCEGDSPGRAGVAAVIHAFDDAGQAPGDEWYERYAQAAMIVAEADLDSIDRVEGRDAKAVTVVIGTVLGDTLFASFRRLAHQHVSHLRYAPDARIEPTQEKK